MSSQDRPSLEFVDDVENFAAANELVVRLPGRYPRKRDLLRALAQRLNFPGYFGHNWDALEECLCDLSWLKAPGGIALVHKQLPLADRLDRQTYFDILGCAQAEQKIRLRIIFPRSAKNQLE
jgi:RNAse (barnase) inhibitor barstar